MNGRLLRAGLVTLLLLAVLGWTQVLGSGVPWFFLGGVAVATVLIGGLWKAQKHLPDLTAALRERFWAREAGDYYAFAGVRLIVQDDGRHVWLDGAGLPVAIQVVGAERFDRLTIAVAQAGRTPFFFRPQYFMMQNPLTLAAFAGLMWGPGGLRTDFRALRGRAA
jgi:hypothetical protein